LKPNPHLLLLGTMRVLDGDLAAVWGLSGGLPMTTLVCTKCGAAFEGKEHRRNKPYCSNLCRYARDKRGEKHHGAKLTEAQVRAIRADPRRQKFIAADYGLHRVHISRIRSRAIWKHVQ
jgi:hypothetical protein